VTQFVVDDLTAQLEEFRGDGYAVLRALQKTQDVLGFVPDSALDVVAKVCNVSRAEVYGVFTFYSDFRTTAPAKCVVKVCVAEACQANGSRDLINQLHKQGFDVHKGTRQGEVQMEQTFCLGNCALGPAALVNGKPVARATAAKLIDQATKAANEATR
jgi:formate dehydrogenase subunit gamma